MKILTLSIKQKYFDEILAGEKTSEYREVRPNNIDRYAFIRFIEGKYKNKEFIATEELPDTNDRFMLVPIKYDALKLITGQYKGTRPWLLVEVEDADIHYLTEDGDIILEDNNMDYAAIEIEYFLGRVLETGK